MEGKREGAKYCSPRCRLIGHRRETVETDNVKLAEPETLSETFKFYTETKDRASETGKVHGERNPTKTVKYWYDVPVSAIPVIQKGWPAKPDYINGRQYFLWWKNNFEVGKGKDPFDGPVLWNPFKKI